tara:strand:+ start:79 stop:393 length:315 start_codon:yes stop_codon:yes gene_type:complete
MTEETTNMEAEMPNVPEAEAGAEAGIPESINLSDLGTLLQIVDLSTQRGAFRGAELTQVGAVFDKLNTFLSYVQQQQAERDEEQTDAPEADVQTDAPAEAASEE